MGGGKLVKQLVVGWSDAFLPTRKRLGMGADH